MSECIALGFDLSIRSENKINKSIEWGIEDKKYILNSAEEYIYLHSEEVNPEEVWEFQVNIIDSNFVQIEPRKNLLTCIKVVNTDFNSREHDNMFKKYYKGSTKRYLIHNQLQDEDVHLWSEPFCEHLIIKPGMKAEAIRHQNLSDLQLQSSFNNLMLLFDCDKSTLTFDYSNEDLSFKLL